MIRQNVGQVEREAFLERRHRQPSRCIRAYHCEGNMTECENAGIADEDIKTDDHNHLDQNAGRGEYQHLAMGCGYRPGNDQQGQGKHRRLPQIAGQRKSAFGGHGYTRSCTALTFTSPLGLSSRIIRIKANTQASRSPFTLVGRMIWKKTFTTPTRKPPSTAPRRLPMPPITTATKAAITSGTPSP